MKYNFKLATGKTITAKRFANLMNFIHAYNDARLSVGDGASEGAILEHMSGYDIATARELVSGLKFQFGSIPTRAEETKFMKAYHDQIKSDYETQRANVVEAQKAFQEEKRYKSPSGVEYSASELKEAGKKAKKAASRATTFRWLAIAAGAIAGLLILPLISASLFTGLIPTSTLSFANGIAAVVGIGLGGVLAAGAHDKIFVGAKERLANNKALVEFWSQKREEVDSLEAKLAKQEEALKVLEKDFDLRLDKTTGLMKSTAFASVYDTYATEPLETRSAESAGSGRTITPDPIIIDEARPRVPESSATRTAEAASTASSETTDAPEVTREAPTTPLSELRPSSETDKMAEASSAGYKAPEVRKPYIFDLATEEEKTSPAEPAKMEDGSAPVSAPSETRTTHVFEEDTGELDNIEENSKTNEERSSDYVPPVVRRPHEFELASDDVNVLMPDKLLTAEDIYGPDAARKEEKAPHRPENIHEELAQHEGETIGYSAEQPQFNMFELDNISSAERELQEKVLNEQSKRLGQAMNNAGTLLKNAEPELTSMPETIVEPEVETPGMPRARVFELAPEEAPTPVAELKPATTPSIDDAKILMPERLLTAEDVYGPWRTEETESPKNNISEELNNAGAWGSAPAPDHYIRSVSPIEEDKELVPETSIIPEVVMPEPSKEVEAKPEGKKKGLFGLFGRDKKKETKKESAPSEAVAESAPVVEPEVEAVKPAETPGVSGGYVPARPDFKTFDYAEPDVVSSDEKYPEVKVPTFDLDETFEETFKPEPEKTPVAEEKKPEGKKKGLFGLFGRDKKKETKKESAPSEAVAESAPVVEPEVEAVKPAETPGVSGGYVPARPDFKTFDYAEPEDKGPSVRVIPKTVVDSSKSESEKTADKKSKNSFLGIFKRDHDGKETGNKTKKSKAKEDLVETGAPVKSTKLEKNEPSELDIATKASVLKRKYSSAINKAECSPVGQYMLVALRESAKETLSACKTKAEINEVFEIATAEIEAIVKDYRKYTSVEKDENGKNRATVCLRELPVSEQGKLAGSLRLPAGFQARVDGKTYVDAAKRSYIKTNKKLLNNYLKTVRTEEKEALEARKEWAEKAIIKMAEANNFSGMSVVLEENERVVRQIEKEITARVNAKKIENAKDATPVVSATKDKTNSSAKTTSKEKGSNEPSIITEGYAKIKTSTLKSKYSRAINKAECSPVGQYMLVALRDQAKETISACKTVKEVDEVFEIASAEIEAIVRDYRKYTTTIDGEKTPCIMELPVGQRGKLANEIYLPRDFQARVDSKVYVDATERSYIKTNDKLLDNYLKSIHADEETINSVKKRSLRLAIPNMARTNNFHGISIVLAENENIIKQVRDKINAKIESGKAGAVENVMIPTNTKKTKNSSKVGKNARDAKNNGKSAEKSQFNLTPKADGKAEKEDKSQDKNWLQNASDKVAQILSGFKLSDEQIAKNKKLNSLQDECNRVRKTYSEYAKTTCEKVHEFQRGMNEKLKQGKTLADIETIYNQLNANIMSLETTAKAEFALNEAKATKLDIVNETWTKEMNDLSKSAPISYGKFNKYMAVAKQTIEKCANETQVENVFTNIQATYGKIKKDAENEQKLTNAKQEKIASIKNTWQKEMREAGYLKKDTKSAENFKEFKTRAINAINNVQSIEGLDKTMERLNGLYVTVKQKAANEHYQLLQPAKEAKQQQISQMYGKFYEQYKEIVPNVCASAKKFEDKAIILIGQATSKEDLADKFAQAKEGLSQLESKAKDIKSKSQEQEKQKKQELDSAIKEKIDIIRKQCTDDVRAYSTEAKNAYALFKDLKTRAINDVKASQNPQVLDATMKRYTREYGQIKQKALAEVEVTRTRKTYLETINSWDKTFSELTKVAPTAHARYKEIRANGVEKLKRCDNLKSLNNYFNNLQNGYNAMLSQAQIEKNSTGFKEQLIQTIKADWKSEIMEYVLSVPGAVKSYSKLKTETISKLNECTKPGQMQEIFNTAKQQFETIKSAAKKLQEQKSEEKGLNSVKTKKLNKINMVWLPRMLQYQLTNKNIYNEFVTFKAQATNAIEACKTQAEVENKFANFETAFENIVLKASKEEKKKQITNLYQKFYAKYETIAPTLITTAKKFEDNAEIIIARATTKEDLAEKFEKAKEGLAKLEAKAKDVKEQAKTQANEQATAEKSLNAAKNKKIRKINFVWSQQIYTFLTNQNLYTQLAGFKNDAIKSIQACKTEAQVTSTFDSLEVKFGNLVLAASKEEKKQRITKLYNKVAEQYAKNAPKTFKAANGFVNNAQASILSAKSEEDLANKFAKAKEQLAKIEANAKDEKTLAIAKERKLAKIKELTETMMHQYGKDLAKEIMAFNSTAKHKIMNCKSMNDYKMADAEIKQLLSKLMKLIEAKKPVQNKDKTQNNGLKQMFKNLLPKGDSEKE